MKLTPTLSSVVELVLVVLRASAVEVVPVTAVVVLDATPVVPVVLEVASATALGSGHPVARTTAPRVQT